jgi:hypothetical protein
MHEVPISEQSNRYTCWQESIKRRKIVMPNYYFNEKLAQAHNQKLLREAAQERLAADLPGHRSSLMRHLMVHARMLLAALGMQLKQFEHLKKHFLRPDEHIS